jgi:HK97 family phage prohead protease
MKTLSVPMEVKTLGDQGEFSGYASVFGNVDQGGDVVERGAFKEIELTKDGMVRVLYQHNMNAPIGKATVKQDERGLAFDGQLVLEVPQARSTYALMKQGITDGMSIGYDVLPGGAEVTNAGVRKLKSLKLWEISVVTFGMNPAARIEDVKSVEAITSVRELETYLRDVGGFSKEAAKGIAARGFEGLSKRRDDGDTDTAANEIAALLRGFNLNT